MFYATKYVYTRDEHDAVTPKKPLPDISYLRWVLNHWHTGPKLQYVAKSRQLMVSWLLSIYGLWTIQMRALATVLLQSKKEEDAAKMIYTESPLIGRASFVLVNLPRFLWGCYDHDGKWVDIPDIRSYVENSSRRGQLVMPNGSKFAALAQGAAQVESWVPTLFLNDEASLQDEWSKAQAAAQPAISGHARGVTVGTMRLPSDYGDEIATCDLVNPDSVMRGISQFVSVSGVSGVRIHYTADPSKDPSTPEGAAWKAEQLASGAYIGGEHGWQWQQHMEINPRVRSGEIVLPAICNERARSRIVIPDIHPARVEAERMMLESGFDWGARNNTVWLLIATDRLGRRYIIHELSVPAKMAGGIPGIAREMKRHPLFEHVNGMIHADPSMWNTDQNTDGGMRSKAEMFQDYGVFLQTAPSKGQHADDIAINRLNNVYWDGWDDEDFRPTLMICESCVNTIQNWQLLVYDEWSDSVAPEKQKKETIKNRHVDEWDAFKYSECFWTESTPIYQAPIMPGTLEWYKRGGASKKEKDGAIYIIQNRP